MTTIIVSFDGLLGVEDDADYDACMAALREAVDSGAADAVLLQKLTKRGPAERSARKAAAGIRVLTGRVANRRIAELPPTFDELLSRRSPNAPKEARYKARRITRRYDGAAVVERLDRADPDRLWTDVEKVASVAYQRTIGVGARRTPAAEAMAAAAVTHGWARVWMLYLAGEPVAFWWGNTYAGTFSVDTTGFDPAYSKDRVGTHVMYTMFEDLCNDPEVDRIDFGHGDADYKRDYATTLIEQRDTIILARRVAPILRGAVLRSAHAGRDLIYWTAQRTAIGERLKRAARASERPSTQTDGDAQTDR